VVRLSRFGRSWSTLWLCTASADGGLSQRAEVAVALAQRYAIAYGDLDTDSAREELRSD
jgi:hypothetical protein